MNINVYQTRSGRLPVLSFITKQEAQAATRIMKDIDRLERRGLSLLADPSRLRRLPGAKNLYELKTYCKGVCYRIILTVIQGEAWLLEACKQSAELPSRYIDTARRRLQLV